MHNLSVILVSALRYVIAIVNFCTFIRFIRLFLNNRICYAGLPDYGMRNTLSIVCTRQYPVITGVLKIGCESRVT